jgi:hypothetical protein
MGRIIKSPAKCWPGQVVLPDALTFPQYIAWKDALSDVERLKVNSEVITVGDIATDEKLLLAVLPGVIACVERWELDNFPINITADTFPATPRDASYVLLSAVMVEINALATQADAVPNE